MQPYPWQQAQWEQVVSQCTGNRAPYAFLLIGPEGSGKTAFAAALAKRLLCESSSSSYACGQCRSCGWVESQTHPDVVMVSSVAGAAVIKIEQIRTLIDQLSQTPVHASCQVVLIEPIEAMNVFSMNALLKTLEEPQGSVIFILITHQPSQVPLTIKSRVQSVYFPIPEPDLGEKWLEQQIASEDLALLLSISGGLPLKALALVKEENLWEERNQLFDLLKALLEKSLYPIQAAESCLKLNLSNLLKNLMSIVTDLMRLALGASSQYLVHIDKVSVLSQFAQTMPLRSLIYYQHQLREAFRQWQNHPNLNHQLLLEYLFIQWRKTCL